MTAKIVPFPVARRRDLVEAVAGGMLKRAPDQAERHLAFSADRQAIVLRRRGIEQSLIDEQIAAFVSAVRAEVWHRVMSQGEAR
ncbi:MAG: hypothetical protein BGP05_01220 [Rhizobiales bacterium 62-47]|nr:hypothetical protein [Hyphomicrobiales bacterium]OJY12005.1 MAG: hypothetical protein BGP05_01220 [Rhizobiales bacterium 62-47]